MFTPGYITFNFSKWFKFVNDYIKVQIGREAANCNFFQIGISKVFPSWEKENKLGSFERSFS